MKPEDILADQENTILINDVLVRKGSVGVFLVNWRILQDPHQREAHSQAKVDMLALIPALHALGLFEALQPRDPMLAELIQIGAV
ncbi:hypothetical protein ACO0K0_08260 [Undibacterium sp. SXout11W]|uniref:hypothetical protein n=1 Tax=Undibacterium sp. SXout11W TaxID=3413050 RepID=UPI003BF13791